MAMHSIRDTMKHTDCSPPNGIGYQRFAKLGAGKEGAVAEYMSDTLHLDGNGLPPTNSTIAMHRDMQQVSGTDGTGQT